MDKFYFASSDGSVRDSEGELYHFGWKKKDAKYIKRERKNGKWVYTYPEETKSGTKATEPAISDRKKQVTSNKNQINAKGNSGKGTGPRTMSKEYEEELGYNSKKNEYPSPKMVTTSGTKSKSDANSKVSAGKNALNTTANVSKEYEAEVAYNSQKNDYGDVTKNTAETQKQTKKDKESWLNKVVNSIKDALGVDEKNAFEKLERDCKQAAEKERNTSEKYREANANFKKDPESKEFGEKLWSTWEDWRKAVDEKKSANDARDAAFEKYLKTPLGVLSNIDVIAKRGLEATGELLDDVAFEVEYAADQVKDWVSDRVDDLEDATIGEARDWYGYDELAAYGEAKRTMNYYHEGREDALGNMIRDMARLKKDPNNEDAAQDVEISTWWYNYWEEQIADYQVHYDYAKTKYELTPKARIDEWVENRLDNLEDWWKELKRHE